MAAIDDLVQQILGQGTTSQWSGAGYGSAEANAKDMARILDSIGITDIRQLGKVPVYRPVQEVGKEYNGISVQVTPPNEEGLGGGEYFYREYTGEYEPNWGSDGGPTAITRTVMVPKDKVEPSYGYIDTVGVGDVAYDQITRVDKNSLVSKDGKLTAKTGETFGNKLTGQAVPNTYSERQTGNFFGGTFAGKGNTGYGVQFQPDGTPVFYTSGASSNDLANILQENKILNLAANVAAATFGGPLGSAALQLAQGKDIKDAAKAAALTYAGQQVMSGFGGGGDASSLAPSDTGGLLDSTGRSALDAGMDVYGTTGNIGLDGLISPVEITGTPSPNFDLISPVEITGTPPPTSDLVSPVEITGTPAPSLVDKAISAASKLSVSDAIRLAGIGATLAGGAKLASGAGGSGSGGFDIVPIPSDWTGPPPTSTAAFTPLPDIDFGNKEMLRGTQWEQLLNPNYRNVPAPTQYAQPSNMSYDELTRILGGSKTSVPTQNLTINDVISGIQNQYGQAPQGSVG
jgi:hypothetical protein